jgi:hypothetical protein
MGGFQHQVKGERIPCVGITKCRMVAEVWAFLVVEQ